jgi:hypothetical protein
MGRYQIRKAYDGVVGGVRHVLKEGEELIGRELAARIELDQPGTVFVGDRPTVAIAKNPDEPAIAAVEPEPTPEPAAALAPEPVAAPSVPADPPQSTPAPLAASGKLP